MNVRRNLMGATGAFAAALALSGALLDNGPMIAAGLINLIACALWLYGQTLEKP